MTFSSNHTVPSPAEQMASLISAAAEQKVLRKTVFSKPKDPSIVRITLTLRNVGGKTAVQAETLQKDNKAKQENLSAEQTDRFAALCSAFGQVNLLTTAGDCELRVSKSGSSVLLGKERLEKALRSGKTDPVKIGGNNREKAYILNGNEPFLRLLDVCDENGRVRDKKQSKFRQINRFLELIRDILEFLPQSGPLRICDLCCGKSYLSFAVYHYFSDILGRTVQMTGVDLKPDVIAYCNETAQKLHFDGLSFLCGDVAQYNTEEHVHLVISLHACDSATDLVLSKALAWNADVILSTPCCHHQMNHTLNCPTLAFLAEHSMLRQKFCDAATDALRLKHLESEGYRTAALELIDPEETPKNIMLRAVRLPHFDPASPAALRLKEEYRTAKAFLIGDANVAF